MRSLLLLPLFLGFSFPANAKSETYYIDVSAESIENYILSGKDKSERINLRNLYDNPKKKKSYLTFILDGLPI